MCVLAAFVRPPANAPDTTTATVVTTWLRPDCPPPALILTTSPATGVTAKSAVRNEKTASDAGIAAAAVTTGVSPATRGAAPFKSDTITLPVVTAASAKS